MLTLSRFIYDLAGLPKPTAEQLDEEIDRLLYIRTAEGPNFLIEIDERDTLLRLDAEILGLWLTKKFKPVLMALMLQSQENYHKSKEELCKMERYNTLVNRILRPQFVRQHSARRIREAYFAQANMPSFEHAIKDLKRLLTMISEHLGTPESDLTLLNTDRYTNADVKLYNFLKRISLGKYRDEGLKIHLRLCEPLMRFMNRYATRNTNVIDISMGDPLSIETVGAGVLEDFVRWAAVSMGAMFLFMYLRS